MWYLSSLSRGIKPLLPALGAQSHYHWATREISDQQHLTGLLDHSAPILWFSNPGLLIGNARSQDLIDFASWHRQF